MPEHKVTTREMWPLFWRGFILQISWSFERMQAIGFCYVMMPVLEQVYKTKKELAARLKNHLEFFNTNPDTAYFIYGVVAAMERSKQPLGAIAAVKAGLMGPVASLGDTLVYTVPRTIALGIAVALAQQGNILGVLLFLVVYTGIKLPIRWFLLKWSYETGLGVLSKVRGSALITRVSEAASVIGIAMVGALIGSMVSLNVVWEIQSGETVLKIQEILDGIVPHLLPVAATMLLFWALRKRISMNRLILAVFVVAIAGASAGVFG